MKKKSKKGFTQNSEANTIYKRSKIKIEDIKEISEKDVLDPVVKALLRSD